MLSTINEAITRLFSRMRDESGQALAEYGLIVALIAVVCIALLTALGLAISGQLGEVSDAIGGGGGS
jgi:pilus assembly protein Flp/PilA